MKKVYYNQADPRWASHPYTAPSYPNATVKSSGCGPTCAAMIISSCKEIITPDVMCDISKENGYRVNGGTADGLFTYICQRWGLEIEKIHSSYEALERCKNGYFVVMCCASGLWTTGGHFILAVGAKDDNIEIYDPYLYAGKFDTESRKGKVTLDGTSAWVQIDTFKANSNVQRLYAIKVGELEEDTSDNTAEQPVTTKIMYINTNSLNLNVRSGAGTNYSVVGSLPKGTQVTVYEEVSGWSRIGTNQWVSSQYLSASKPESISAPKTTVGTVTASALNVRSGAGTRYSVVKVISRGTQVTIYETKGSWGRIGDGQWVYMQYIKIGSSTVVTSPEPTTKTMYVNTSSANLNVRSGAGTGYSVVKTLAKGTQVTVYEEKNGWVRIGTNQWVSSQYLSASANTVTTKTMYVNTSSANLNIRSGAGTGYKVVGSLKKGTQVTVYEEKNGWARIGTNQWVSSKYLKL